MARLLFGGYRALLLLLLVFQTSNCKDTNLCAPSCGKHPISYPFSLESDPSTCGNLNISHNPFNYTLHCEKNTSAVLYLDSRKYYVQAINYNNLTIRVVDAGVKKNDCSSLPDFSLAFDSLGESRRAYTIFTSTFAGFDYMIRFPYTWFQYRKTGTKWFPKYKPLPLSQMMIFINCANPVNSTLYVDTGTCLNGAKYSNVSRSMRSYVNVRGMKASDVMELCSLERMTLLPAKDYKNMSFKEIHSQLAYGFELSWHNSMCGSCGYGCYIDDSYHTKCIDRLSWLELIAALLQGPKFIFGSPFVIAFLIYKWRRRHLSAYDTVEEFLQTHNNLMPVIRYSYSEIKKMTGGFKEELGKGGFGCVYKGKLRSGHSAAIKLLGKSKANGQDFINEVATIGRIRHTNVVQLVGFCAEGSKCALVYDFMPNGSLNNFIFSQERPVSLSWEKLHEISLGVARGIEYLHRGCEMQILYFDIKPHNILLDENFAPKVSDFGLARLCPANETEKSLTAAGGTIGYMAPELFYKNIGRVSYKADVYSFGMLLLEMAGKRKNPNVLTENSSQIYWPDWVHDQVSNEKAIEIGDGGTEEEEKIVKKMIIVGLWCIQMNPLNRPAMNKVVEMLEGDMKSLQLPPRPVLNLDEKPMNTCGESSSMSDYSSESVNLIENAYN
ncbi:LEAF RUST 10 DISEASE-RESISTANCE LOCUS RECEPTOR-LIKE PROTEIN KINASE-like 2.1 [Populus nigra]|uniref:LEAF RUST 10 DISEASE-RESISTANCE LOCUS RECEPTOR-LIKE PROTEIN KINASE-like 2.1 n=1 Tax=Populus nigra TaxID=3691 RepID=UPI002B26FAF8|nr:LEAF RUST 10 DISEASE-RESISTANCE LOCUS RECEPTOR-LIKE PROTEIN KINASE-like 2.1 [Populus nigra]